MIIRLRESLAVGNVRAVPRLQSSTGPCIISPDWLINSQWGHSDGGSTCFGDPYLPQGGIFDTDLRTLNFAAVKFQIWWRILDNGSTAWHTTGPQTWGGEVIPIFGIAWDEHDLYRILWPE